MKERQILKYNTLRLSVFYPLLSVPAKYKKNEMKEWSQIQHFVGEQKLKWLTLPLKPINIHKEKHCKDYLGAPLDCTVVIPCPYQTLSPSRSTTMRISWLTEPLSSWYPCSVFPSGNWSVSVCNASTSFSPPTK